MLGQFYDPVPRSRPACDDRDTLPTYTVVILDENKDEVVPDGEIGEIGIAGVALARGYLNREDLTAQKFIPDFLNIPNNLSKRIYRTGDLGRIREDGELDFHGRIDTQVKIRGYRIELGEIEALLMQRAGDRPGRRQPVRARARRGGDRRVLHPQAGRAGGRRSDVAEMLRRNLPSYMVPGYLEELPLIPMTPNNKADRKACQRRRDRASRSTSKFVAPSTRPSKLWLTLSSIS